LRDKTGADDDTKADLTLGIEAANRVLHQANAAVDRELRFEALEDLCVRVDDWKNHRVDHFGELLLHGHFPVVTGKSDVQKEVRTPSDLLRAAASIGNLRRIGSKCKELVSNNRYSDSLLARRRQDATASQWTLLSPRKSQDCVNRRTLSILSEIDLFLGNMIFHHFDGVHPITGDPFLAEQYANRLGISCPQYDQYTIYLFERILLCCKEVNPNKSKDKLMGAQKDKKDKKDKYRSKEPNKNAKLQLKGRIFMTNVTEVMSLAKQGIYSQYDFLRLCLPLNRFLFCTNLLERGPGC
jgi:hypothetical protein